MCVFSVDLHIFFSHSHENFLSVFVSFCLSVCIFIYPFSLSMFSPSKELPGQFGVKPAKAVAQINWRGQRQPLRARVVGAVGAIRNPTTQPYTHPGWLQIREPTHMLRQIGARGDALISWWLIHMQHPTKPHPLAATELRPELAARSVKYV